MALAIPAGSRLEVIEVLSHSIHLPPALMFESLNTVVGQWVEQWGYAGIIAGMVLENVIPPIPSELIMPLAGFYAAQGQLNLVLVVVSGVIGTVIGALPWYGVGRLVNEERLGRWIDRHGRWVGVSAADLSRSRSWFQRHGAKVVFWGRLIPAIRTLISVPAGIEMMPFGSFLFWTTAGSLLWNLVLTLAGYFLGSHWNQVIDWVKPVEGLINKLIVLVVLAAVVWLGLRLWGRRQRGL